MEAVPRLPMICFDLKVSPDRHPADFGKLKQYIRDFYHEDPESYNTEIHKLESLRAMAVRPATDVTGCSVLKRYYCQLHFLQSRFPMSKDGASAVTFTWRDTYANMVCSLADIRFEIVSVLYNIGALHSQLGAADSRSSAEGLKLACTHFQCAAWAFQHLKDTYPQPAGVDLAPDIMQFMYHLCLAQAQECILEKSMTDNRKATINAKVAAQIVDFYNMAFNVLTHNGHEDTSVVMETVGGKLYRNWKHYMRFKMTYYDCIALLYQGQQSEEQQKMGERVAYYQAAFDKLNEAIKVAKGLNYPEGSKIAIEEALTFTMDVVEGKRKAAKNENEFIYHEEVPDKDSLPDIKGASLVKGIPFSVTDADISGPDIFARLVPMKAHEASSLYSEEKAKLLRKIGAQIDEKDQELVAFMSSLQLDHLNAHLQPNKLPQELVDRCAALGVKPDAIKNLINAMDKLSDTYHDVEGMLKEIMELIQIEEQEEKEYQEVMGSRPPSIVATDLTREANKYLLVHNKAAESNKTLHTAMTQHIANLRVMELPPTELMKQIPSVAVLQLEEDPAVQEMIHLVGKVEEMRRQRSMLATQLRESVCGDDITAQLVTRQGENLDSLFSQELQKHSKYVALIEQNLAAQDNILKALTDAYAQYVGPRKATQEILRQRNMTISALMSSYDAYEDLLAKSSKGQEFYRKLETNVTKLLQRVKGTCKVQQEERDTILAKNGKQLPSKMKKQSVIVDAASDVVTSQAATNASGLKLKDYLQNMKKGYPVLPGSTPTGSQYYSTGGISYGSMQIPPAASPQPVGGYVEPSSLQSDNTQTWIPAVRPAPVGSEGTAPICSNTAKPDSKSESYTSYSNPSATNYSGYSSLSSNYAQNTAYSQYMYNAAKPYSYPDSTISPVSYPIADYPSLDSYPTTSSPYQAVSNTANDTLAYSKYSQNYQAATAVTVSQQNYQAGHSYPAGVTPVTQSYQPGSGAVHTYTVGQTYHPTAGVAQTYQAGSTTGHIYSQGQQNYQAEANAGQTYPVGQTTDVQGYTMGTNYPTPSPSHIVQNYQASSGVGQNSTTPSGSYQAGTADANTASTGQSFQVGQAYADAGSNYNQTYQTYQPTQQYQTGSYQTPSAVPGHTYTGTYPQYQETVQPASLGYQYTSDQKTSSIASPSHSVPSDQSNRSSVQTTASTATVSNTQVAYTQAGYSYVPATDQQSYSNYYLSQQHQDSSSSAQVNQHMPWTSQQAGYMYGSGYSSVTSNKDGHVPAPVVQTTDVGSVQQQQQYSVQNYYTGGVQQPYSNYTQATTEFQYTPSTGSSCYTHAGHNQTLQTNSSQPSIQGQTYAIQYSSSTPDAGTAGSCNQNYYYYPYGYQYTNGMPESPSADKPNPVSDSSQGVMTPQSPMTYMQASNNNMTVTYSQQHNGRSLSSSSSEEKKESSSNVDLLAGLDFSVSQAPLEPQPVVTKEKEPEKPSASKPAIPTITDIVEEKLAALSVSQPVATTAASSSPIRTITEVKPVQETVVVEKGTKEKTVPKDPFSDNEVLNQFVQEVEKFEKFVEGLTVKTLNGPTPLDIKWKELLDIQEKDSHKQIISVARCYPMKNRFPDILPYDNSRVELPSTKDDYINASFVKGIAPQFPDFIVTQLPLHSTFGDFWSMVTEHQVELIVCLLNDYEIEGQVYWPVEKGTELVIGRMKLSLQSTNVRKHWVERIIYVNDSRTTHTVVHLQFTEWPGSSYPASPGPFLSLVGEALTLQSQQRGSGPCVVHCLSGVGRAGLFLLATAAVCHIQSTPTLPDLVVLAGKISAFRKNALRDREHLKFAYQTLLYYAQDLLMKRGILTSKRTKTHTRHPSEDFLKGPPKGGQQQTESPGSGTSASNIENKPVDPLSQIDPLWPIKRLQ